MRLYLQINITDWKEETYDKPLLSFASGLADDIMGTDLDSQSDAYVADLVVKLVDQAKAVFLLVNAHPDVPLGVANIMLNNLLKNRERITHAVLCGHHEFAEKLLRPFGEKFKKVEEEGAIKKLLQEFAGPAHNQRFPEN
jgi:hypothetical protein